MSDGDIGEELDIAELMALAAFEHHGQFIFSLLDGDGQLHTFGVTRNKLEQVAHLIVSALDGVPISSLDALRELGLP